MNFLVDNPLSPSIAAGLRAAGHDAIHVLDYRMQAASDEAIFERAALESRVVVSADTDFGTLLSLRESTSPSVILFRGETPKLAAQQVALILTSLPAVEAALLRGAIVILERYRLRSPRAFDQPAAHARPRLLTDRTRSRRRCCRRSTSLRHGAAGVRSRAMAPPLDDAAAGRP